METSDQGDIQGNMAWKHAEDYFMRLHSPTFGKVNLATDLCASKDGTKISFTGKIWDKLEGSPTSRICIIDLSGLLSSTATLPASGFKVVTRGPNNDSHGRWSPDGETLAFLSDREEKGINQLYLLKGSSLGEAFLACRFQGSVEYFHWDSKGSRILIAVAGLDADVGDADGSGKIGDSKGKVPDWMPTVTAGVSKSAWRDLYVYELGEGVAKNLATPLNVWDASWYGENEVIAVATTEPGEGEWYRPLLLSLRFDSHDADIDTSEKGLSTHQPLTGRSTNDDMTLKKPALRVKTRHLYASKVQLGGPTSTPSGKTFAVLEALCSDRDLFAGNVVLGQDDAIEVVELDVDITYIEWRNESALFCMGIRGPSSIAGEIVLRDGGIKGAYFVESWRSSSHCGGTYPSGTAFSKSPFAVMVEDWDLYPEMRLVNEGRSQVIISFAHFGSEHLSSIIGSKEQVKWNAPDGLELDGFLQLPKFGHKPYPLILAAHGGPVFSFRNRWPGSSETAYLSSLSYAILSTNPRGSSGRGQHFAARVLGDIGGGETQDHLSGIDAMIKCGIADPERIGVMGASHGGFMSSWLITQDDRFKAAVPIAAINDWRSQ
ncbi:MAG: hypothetical protein M1818_006644 [Claussenomyces sp. TS43310]|nr:MAG: hypothetical protein M1818_006644 [Claussenomyces sp. TS43310]